MSRRSTSRTSRTDLHHPQVHRTGAGHWTWVCACGGASCRTALQALSWRQAVAGAMYHAGTLAA